MFLEGVMCEVDADAEGRVQEAVALHRLPGQVETEPTLQPPDHPAAHLQDGDGTENVLKILDQCLC